MRKKYICVRNSIRQHEVDNWLLMIPSHRLSSDSKLVYLILKKIQAPDLSCMTDANSWYKISGLRFDRVRECLVELQQFGLVDLYHSTSSIEGKRRTTFTAYLLDHFLMKDMYPKIDCPHDGDSFPHPERGDNVLRHSHIARTIQDVQQSAQGFCHDENTAHQAT